MISFFNRQKKRVYLDYASATPMSCRVQDKMRSVDSYYCNPGGLYRESIAIQGLISDARTAVAQSIGARPSQIYFMDGATEANNFAVFGVIEALRQGNAGIKPHIITTKIEHSSILEPVRFLVDAGYVDVDYVSVDKFGCIDLGELKKYLRPETVLLSFSYVNGEIGTIQDIRSIMKTVRHHRKKHKTAYPYVHVDAVQAINYVELIDIHKLGVDMMTISSSKIYGPKKTAALFIKTGVQINSVMFGGNQERGLRPGTEDIQKIIGIAESIVETREMQSIESDRLYGLQQYLESEIKKYDENIILNSSATEKIPNIVNISIPNISHEELVIRLDAAGFMCSVKSACKSGEDGDSHVISAIAAGDSRPTGSVRISMGRHTHKPDIQKFIKSFIQIVDSLKETYKKYYSGE